jgi:hypothetical protein
MRIITVSGFRLTFLRGKILSAIVLSFILFSCKEVKKNDTPKSKGLPKTTTATTTRKRPSYKSLSEVVGEKEILKYWAAIKSYYPTLHFITRDTLYLEFNGQCEYSFPFKLTDDSIVIYWDLIENCTHNIGIKKTFGLRDRPLIGKPFMTLRLVNDTTLQAVYLHREWVNHFNCQYKGYKYLPETFLSVGD